LLWLYAAVLKNVWEKTMKAIILSLVAVAALAIPVSSPASAAGADGLRNANAQMHHDRHWHPKKHTYGKRMRAHTGARCKMTGSC
jgi:Ni/Co efflux regulator RcnB